MLLKYFRITAIGDTGEALKERGRETSWDIQAGDLASAWGKFCHQRFGALKPNPAEFDIRFSHTKSV